MTRSPWFSQMHHLLPPQLSPQLSNQFLKKFSPSTSFLFQPLQSPSYLLCYPVLIINRQSFISREISQRLHFHSLLDLGTSHMVHGAIDTKIAIESLKFDMGHSKSSVPLSLVCLKKRWWPYWQVMLNIQVAMSEKKNAERMCQLFLERGRLNCQTPLLNNHSEWVWILDCKAKKTSSPCFLQYHLTKFLCIIWIQLIFILLSPVWQGYSIMMGDVNSNKKIGSTPDAIFTS